MPHGPCPVCDSRKNFSREFATNPMEAANHFLGVSDPKITVALKDHIRTL
jgi:hypothetical protein